MPRDGRGPLASMAGELPYITGVALWLVAYSARWPASVSFGDEVGYIGQARLFLAGHVRPLIDAPGVWMQIGGIRAGKYPLFMATVIAPLLAITPRLVFLIGPLSALAVTLVARRILVRSGCNSAWALLPLAHPTVVLLARTVMPDLLMAACALAACWAVENRRRAAIVILVGLTVAVKPIGLIVGIALAAGELTRSFFAVPSARSRDAQAAQWAIAGTCIGLLVSFALNFVGTGHLWFAYDQSHTYIGVPAFWPRHFLSTAPPYAISLMAVPPLLFLGFWQLWRIGSLGAVLVAAALIIVMSFYFFVDRGNGLVETLVVSPRLILPAVAILLIGYAVLLGRVVKRLPWLERASIPVLVIIPALVCHVVSTRHSRWQAPQGNALAAATLAAQHAGVREIGIAGGADKAGILFDGVTRAISQQNSGERPTIVLCRDHYDSYRDPAIPMSCRIPGYKDRALADGFHLLMLNQS